MGLSQLGVSPGRQKVVAILDFVTVTLIFNEGSSLALHSSSDSRAAVNRTVRGIAERAAPMVKKRGEKGPWGPSHQHYGLMQIEPRRRRRGKSLGEILLLRLAGLPCV